MIVDPGILYALLDRHDQHHGSATEFIAEPVHPADRERMAELVARYRDLPLGTVDASLVALAARTSTRPAPARARARRHRGDDHCRSHGLWSGTPPQDVGRADHGAPRDIGDRRSAAA